MDIKELIERIDLFDKKLIQTAKSLWWTKKEQIYARALKLWEEVWELNSDILAQSWAQRKHKLEKFTDDSLRGEFADVIITTFILAKSMDIDIFKAIEYKLKKIKERWGI